MHRHHLRLTQVGAKPGQAAPSLGAHRWHSRLPIDPRGLGGGNVLTALCSKHFSGGGNRHLPAETLIVSKLSKIQPNLSG